MDCITLHTRVNQHGLLSNLINGFSQTKKKLSKQNLKDQRKVKNQIGMLY